MGATAAEHRRPDEPAKNLSDAVQPALAEAIHWLTALASALLSRTKDPNLFLLHALSKRQEDFTPEQPTKRRKMNVARAALTTKPRAFRSRVFSALPAAEHGAVTSSTNVMPLKKAKTTSTAAEWDAASTKSFVARKKEHGTASSRSFMAYKKERDAASSLESNDMHASLSFCQQGESESLECSVDWGS